ncbi:hypothetical protein ONS95_012925 [Cadophora gregata]|uniref:uncharacterized protein n=1 Tax=Cadophora gregata TaxID=51156 RepID=UPI0026DB29A7|nr:uncharacterized protein ONS95_012925 [Cadophora gregata]KAK0115878.1 hypothetical protein ONS95_012925 [Cadophora gregata]
MGFSKPLLLQPLKRVGISLLPTFIQPLLDPSQQSCLGKISPTSYLDGLRGIAALFVYIYHVEGKYLPTILPAYGLPLSQDQTPYPSSPLQLPGIRLIFSGHPMVHIFFVISGYALSLKSLKQLRANEHAAVLSTVSSALFRRAMRLFLPVLGSTFIGQILLWIDLRPGGSTTFAAQMGVWWTELKQILDFWWPDQRVLIHPDPHLWTIPIEMANSVILFAVLIALSRCKVQVRMALVAAIILVAMRAGQWVVSEFLMGMWLAELGLIQQGWETQSSWSETHQVNTDGEDEVLLREEGAEDKEGVLQPGYSPRQQTRFRQLKQLRRIVNITLKVVCTLSLIPTIWLAGWPQDYAEQDPGFNWIIRHTGSAYNMQANRIWLPWFGLVAFFIIFACQQLKFLQAIFTTPAVRYLGKISYSMYLIHWSVLESMAPRLFPPVLRWATGLSGGNIGGWGVTLVFLLTLAFITPVLIWVADLFCVFIDDNSVAFAKWVEGKCKREDL